MKHIVSIIQKDETHRFIKDEHEQSEFFQK